MRISDWSSDVCSSDLTSARLNNALRRMGSGWALFIEAERRPAADYPHSDFPEPLSWLVDQERRAAFEASGNHFESAYHLTQVFMPSEESRARAAGMLYENRPSEGVDRSEEHTSALQSIMRISYAAFCLKQKNVSTPYEPT